MIVPLKARGRVLGSMTLLSTRAGRHYAEADLAFAEALAARCALAIDNARLHDRAERSLSLLDTVFATAPVGLAFVDRDLRFVRVNDTFAAFKAVADAHRPHAASCSARPRALGPSAVLDRELTDRTGPRDRAGGRATGTSPSPRSHADGVGDRRERRRGRRHRAPALLDAEREARVRADFLARAGACWTRRWTTSRPCAPWREIAIPEIADWCAVTMLDRAGELRQVAAAHVDPASAGSARSSTAASRRPALGDAAPSRVARTGRDGVRCARSPTRCWSPAIEDPEQLALVRRLGAALGGHRRAAARGRTFGTLTPGHRASPGGRSSQADVQLAEELARRAGMAIDNARLYTERARIAHTLQVKLLPHACPRSPALDVAARYRAAGELNEVGGDFYDVFPRVDDRVGDGRRRRRRARAPRPPPSRRWCATRCAPRRRTTAPPGTLRRLNTAMLPRADDGPVRHRRAGLPVAAPRRPGSPSRSRSAGHPPPLSCAATARVEPVGRSAPCSACVCRADVPTSRLTLEPGDSCCSTPTA